MSFTSTACCPQAKAASSATRPPVGHPHPAHYQAHGRLYRAIVSLPDSMCERDRTLQERWVFFDCPTGTNPGHRLEALLALAWNISTIGWCDRGYVYNLVEASALIAQNDADDDTALFECEWGCEGTKHIPLQDVDFLCTPRVRARLELALLQANVGTTLERGAKTRESLQPDLAARAQALLKRGRSGIVSAAITNNATTLEFWKGFTEAARDVSTGLSALAAAKDVLLAESDQQTGLKAAITGLPESTKRLTLPDVRQILAAHGIEITLDGVPHDDLCAGEVLERSVLPRIDGNDEHPVAGVHMRHCSSGHSHLSPIFNVASLDDMAQAKAAAAQGGAA